MALSVFDLFTVGIGPSSSHTVGPMRAAQMYVQELRDQGCFKQVSRVQITLYGSLGATGKGHGTDFAVILGLLGEAPDTVAPYDARGAVNSIAHTGKLLLAGAHEISFNSERDVVFAGAKELPLHPNGLEFIAYDAQGAELLRRRYYSIGGGFVISDAAATKVTAAGAGDCGDCEGGVLRSAGSLDSAIIPYPFNTAAQLLEICAHTGLSIAAVMLANEATLRTEATVRAELHRIWEVMNACIEQGCIHEGMLPGSLHVTRRAPRLARRLQAEGRSGDPLAGMDWITLYAMAVNEENAAGGRVVTAPTTGAAGVIPAVLRYYLDFMPGASEAGIARFLLTAGAIGIIVKQNASISGAEVGCQGEVGVACAMAAAAASQLFGGTLAQIEYAAEMGLEHHLGLTCDPVGGLVQIPCMERNAFAAARALDSNSYATFSDGFHRVSFDEVVEVMKQTGHDLPSLYKETAEGGLATRYPGLRDEL